MTAVSGGWWLRRSGRWLLRFLMRGFASLAAMSGVLPASSFAAASQEWLAEDGAAPRSDGVTEPGSELVPLDGPPSAHPERLVVGVPLSPGERALWAQLEGRGRLS
ncbi:DUF6059 family protein [Streptomyces albipurpureus]|uniref:Uncharacterized protein n=1 Tax=Streptomyces albipurpureus TaxID=2897419 RepID=A0ABT0UZF5_9ACTN|nr:DUF6059 family protein [Streptomyces sp. CWNU-1]MCM2393826.1 hypothetical protein [Streptomyces sp. CWNU-1]